MKESLGFVSAVESQKRSGKNREIVTKPLVRGRLTPDEFMLRFSYRSMLTRWRL
ncbi:MAG: hypothetical protein KAU52_04865 [Methanosarcinales archaeon]|nr:hypothetical protein [Methanosarcinales archaeon]